MPASISLTDAIAITGATVGKAITEKEVTAGPLNNTQKTALGNFITSLGGSWPGGSGNILAVSAYRNPSTPTQINVTVRGLLVYADLNAAAPALNTRSEEYVGVVPPTP
jgi:hypothetical protein